MITILYLWQINIERKNFSGILDLNQTVSGSDHLVNRIRIRVLSTQGSVKTCGLRNRSLLFLSMAMELLESPKQGCGSRWRPPGSDFREKTDPRYFRTPDTDPTFIWNLVRSNLFFMPGPYPTFSLNPDPDPQNLPEGTEYVIQDFFLG